MKAITLWQPWATWIAKGWKTIETRTHRRFRSLAGERIAIHAGKTYDRDALTLANRYLTTTQVQWTIAARKYLPQGAVICTALAWQFRRLGSGDGAQALIDPTDRFGLFLSGVEVLTSPVPARGALAPWPWTPPGEPQVAR